MMEEMMDDGRRPETMEERRARVRACVGLGREKVSGAQIGVGTKAELMVLFDVADLLVDVSEQLSILIRREVR